MSRLKTLCLVLLIVFLASLYQSVIVPFVEGFQYGLTIANFESDNQVSTQEFVLLNVRPKYNNYMDMSEINLKTNETVLVRPDTISIVAQLMPEKPFWWLVLQAFSSLLLLGVMGLGAWIVFLVLKILKSLDNSSVFERTNLKRIKKIGVFLISLGVVISVMQILDIVMAKQMIDLMHYEFSFSHAVDFNILVMGIVVLVMNEILRLAIDLKEDQDLTI